MTAFLYISSPGALAQERRVNFADIANLFGEAEPPARRSLRVPVHRIALAVLVVFGLVGDTLLVARADTLATCFASGPLVHPTAIASDRS